MSKWLRRMRQSNLPMPGILTTVNVRTGLVETEQSFTNNQIPETLLYIFEWISSGYYLPVRVLIGERLSAICFYSTASTPNAAYIIGGPGRSDLIAEFKDNKWRRYGSLNNGRTFHGSLSVNDQTFIIGGNAKSGESDTELWDFATGERKTMNPVLDTDRYQFGIGIYPVHFEFCST